MSFQESQYCHYAFLCRGLGGQVFYFRANHQSATNILNILECSQSWKPSKEIFYSQLLRSSLISGKFWMQASGDCKYLTAPTVCVCVCDINLCCMYLRLQWVALVLLSGLCKNYQVLQARNVSTFGECPVSKGLAFLDLCFWSELRFCGNYPRTEKSGSLVNQL